MEVKNEEHASFNFYIHFQRHFNDRLYDGAKIITAGQGGKYHY